MNKITNTTIEYIEHYLEVMQEPMKQLRNLKRLFMRDLFQKNLKQFLLLSKKYCYKMCEKKVK